MYACMYACMYTHLMYTWLYSQLPRLPNLSRPPPRLRWPARPARAAPALAAWLLGAGGSRYTSAPAAGGTDGDPKGTQDEEMWG